MIKLDLKNLEQRALNAEGCYIVGFRRVDKVLLNGEQVTNCIYADIPNKFMIISKLDLTGKPIIYEDDFVYDIVFGDIEVILNDLAK